MKVFYENFGVPEGGGMGDMYWGGGVVLTPIWGVYWQLHYLVCTSVCGFFWIVKGDVCCDSRCIIASMSNFIGGCGLSGRS